MVILAAVQLILKIVALFFFFFFLFFFQAALAEALHFCGIITSKITVGERNLEQISRFLEEDAKYHNPKF